MDNREVLVQEYNNLWNEKLIHKQSIRKFHHYLTYLTAVGSLALTFYGISPKDFFNPATADQVIKNAANITYLVFVLFTPIVIITLTFPLNDLFHIYAIGNQLSEIERKINSLSEHSTLLAWEHAVCPVVYGGREIEDGTSHLRMTNLITRGDVMLLAPVLGLLCIFTTIVASTYICAKVGCLFTVIYDFVVAYMACALISLFLKLMAYIKPDGILTRSVQICNARFDGTKNP